MCEVCINTTAIYIYDVALMSLELAQDASCIFFFGKNTISNKTVERSLFFNFRISISETCHLEYFVKYERNKRVQISPNLRLL